MVLRCAACATPLPGHSRFCLSCGTAVPVPATDESPATVLRQLVQQELGGEVTVGQEAARGLLTVTFEATETRDHQPVLVHVVPPELARLEGGVVDRLLRAARLASGLRHPRIVPIVRVAAGDRLAWYIERRVEGETLEAVLEREYQLPVERVVALLGHVATALGCAHERGVLHGGLTPAAVVVARADGGAVVRDVGIARASRTSSVNPADDPERCGYLAPELTSPDGPLAGTGLEDVATPASAAGDQYALAIMVYQMLAGSLPFIGESPGDVRREHRSAPLPPLTVTRPDLPAALSTVLEHALAKNPADRYPSVTRFAAAFRLAAQGRPSPTRGVTRRTNDTLFMPAGRTRPRAVRGALAAGAATLLLFLVAWKAKDPPWSSDTVNSRLVAPWPESPSVATAYGNTAPPVRAPGAAAAPASAPRTQAPDDVRRPAADDRRRTPDDERQAPGAAPVSSITLGTNPYSTMYINGIASPTNPVRNWTVPPGRVSLRFEVTSSSGGAVVVDTSITVAAGESLNLGFVRLGNQP